MFLQGPVFEFRRRLLSRRFAKCTNIADDLANLFVAQLVREARHVRLAVVDNPTHVGIAPFLNIFRAKICCLQLFAQGRCATTISAMAKCALALENARAGG